MIYRRHSLRLMGSHTILAAVAGVLLMSRVTHSQTEPYQAPVAGERGTVAVEPALGSGAIVEGTFKYARPLILGDGGGRLVELPLDAAALSHSRGPDSRFADVRIVDASNRQVPYLVERRTEPLAVDVAMVRVAPEQIPDPLRQGGGGSVYRLTLPQRGLPAGSLMLMTSATTFERGVRLGVIQAADRPRRAAWFDELASVRWRHNDSAATATALSVPVRSVATQELWLAIDEGDNAPLPLTGARLFLPSYRLRFFAPANSALRLAYGRNDLTAPRYDLALLSKRLMGAAATDIAAAPESAAEAPVPFISPRLFWVLLSVSAAVLLGLIARLARRAAP